MTPDRIPEKLAEGVRLAKELLRVTEKGEPFIEVLTDFERLWNPAFVLEFARMVEGLRELLNEWLLLGDLPGGGFGGTLEARTRAALANPAAEAGE